MHVIKVTIVAFTFNGTLLGALIKQFHHIVMSTQKFSTGIKQSKKMLNNQSFVGIFQASRKQV